MHSLCGDTTPNLEFLDFRGMTRVPQQYLRQIAKDYAHNKELCVNFEGVLELDDADLHIFAEAGVQWHKLDIGGTIVTEAGIRALSKSCPNLQVK